MDLWAIIAAWSALALATALSPGPDTLLVVGHAARSGQKAGLLAVAGIQTGGLWYVLLCGFGMLSVLTASPVLFSAVKLVGALYLAWIGFTLIRGMIKPAKQSSVSVASLGPKPFLQGVLTNILNPKVALFYLAALPQFVGSGDNAPYIGMLLIAIHYAFGGVWLSFLAISTSKASRTVSQSSIWRWLEGLLGAAFIGLAGKLALERN
jgi:threonine/homoserine/homoserine lactone efflux protein